MVRAFSTYFATNALRAGIPFLLLPVLTLYLTPAEYGLLSLFQALVLFVLPLTPFNIDGAVGVAYFRCRKGELPSYISSALLAPLATTVGVVAVLSILSAVLSELTHIPVPWLAIAPIFGLAQLLPKVALKLHQMRREPLVYAGINVALAALNVTLSLVAVAVFHWGWQGRMAGVLAANAAVSAASLVILRRRGYLTARVRREYLFDAARFSFFLIPHSLGGTLMALSDRFLLSAMVGVEAVGSYAVGYQLGSALLIVGSSVNQAFSPLLYAKLGSADMAARIELVRRSYKLAAGLGAAFVSFCLLMPLVFPYFVADRFADSQRYAVWIALAGLFNGLYALVGNYIFYEKKTYLLSALTLGSGLLNIVLNYIWIGRYGTIGAAYASAASSFVFFILCWVLAQRVHPMPWWQALKARSLAAAPAAPSSEVQA